MCNEPNEGVYHLYKVTHDVASEIVKRLDARYGHYMLGDRYGKSILGNPTEKFVDINFKLDEGIILPDGKLQEMRIFVYAFYSGVNFNKTVVREELKKVIENLK